jgi:phosphatidylglycerophosphate synthase
MAMAHLGLLDSAHDRLGWPNRLSLLRANLPALNRPPAPWTALLALATDWADGRLARNANETDFGAYADPLADVVFWVWYLHHHEPSRILRRVGTTLWLAPAVGVTAAYVVRGRTIDVPRPIAGRNVSVGLQVLVAARAIHRACFDRSRRPGGKPHFIEEMSETTFFGDQA